MLFPVVKVNGCDLMLCRSFAKSKYNHSELSQKVGLFTSNGGAILHYFTVQSL